MPGPPPCVLPGWRFSRGDDSWERWQLWIQIQGHICTGGSCSRFAGFARFASPWQQGHSISNAGAGIGTNEWHQGSFVPITKGSPVPLGHHSLPHCTQTSDHEIPASPTSKPRSRCGETAPCSQGQQMSGSSTAQQGFWLWRRTLRTCVSGTGQSLAPHFLLSVGWEGCAEWKQKQWEPWLNKDNESPDEEEWGCECGGALRDENPSANNTTSTLVLLNKKYANKLTFLAG